MNPLASCILPTYNRRAYLPQAIRYFLRQDYPRKELIILDDGSDCVRDLIPADPQIRYFRLDQRATIGAKRNRACNEANGDIILHWDDDDWMADWRVSYQVSELVFQNKAICGLDRLLYYDPAESKAWEYVYPPGPRPWVAGNTLCYRKSFWRQHPFPDVSIAEDARFVWQAASHDVARLKRSQFIVGLVHSTNVSPKTTTGCYWNPRPLTDVESLLGGDAGFYRNSPAPKALVSASLGVGDILRVTPLIRIFRGLGYDVDLLLEPDYPEAIQLLEGHPEAGDIFFRTSQRVTPRQERLAGLADRNYEIATFTTWSAPLQFLVNCKRKFVFDRADWLRNGDSHCIEKIAREAGWKSTMPAPLAVTSGRQFDLEPGTIAIHPGCKPDWPWKKWHGFDELAALFPNVALIGTKADLENGRTYFKRPFEWPAQVMNYVGALDLRDTAALLSQCSALVSNDSGMMHLGVALGIPVFGVFGITSPQREAIPAPNMFPITKGLACEDACRKKAWGRSDCEHHLRCLTSLTAEEVHARVRAVLPAPTVRKPVTMQKLNLVYHGHVFDSSGYGNAARAYIHSLHAAGVELSVVDLSHHQRQVSDPLVESLVGRAMEPDFHLFHGIPTIWSREAFRIPNAIAMTVWETDSMPQQWRNTLNHTLETWLPCDFNVSTFQHQLSKPVFKLPHAMLPAGEASPPEGSFQIEANPEDFVFYSIFEWQDRKHPLGQLTAYFQAFPEDGPHLFVCKTNPGAAHAAAGTVEEARRATGSRARVSLHCAAWTDSELDALHRRGNCYVSLHRGEGWGYPLFEAACRGIPVVATAYSGPLEYLNGDSHQLVPYRLTPVRQPYVYYNSRMRWADPDLSDAAARMRWVFEHQQDAREKARLAAPALQRRYAPAAIGELAKERLYDLLKRNNRPRWQSFRNSTAVPVPPTPIPGDWYDAAYFEHGIKSNWEGGYTWRQFQGLFQDVAGFLTSSFPAAKSFVDAGCAKGFLVRTLRERGREAWGFDCSQWAIDHAVEGVHPYLKTADACQIEWDRTFEFTVALDLLSHLTQEQAVAFLTRARTFTTGGILATIELRQDPQPEPGNDRTHVTLETREWWHQRFLEAGWRQDGLHQIVQSGLQNHPLPTKMGWHIFLYATA